MPDAWESRDSRRTLGGISTGWPRDGACGDVAPVPDAECSRPAGHAGRHMASLGGGWGHRIVAAWPGPHPPAPAQRVADRLTRPRHTRDPLRRQPALQQQLRQLQR